MKNKNGDDVGWFCVLCFADERGGSWDEGTVPNAGFCANCGAGSSLVPLPLWGIDAIRKNASWVGKRYYPTDEDREAHREIDALRLLVNPLAFPGRSVARWDDAEGKAHTMVSQLQPDGQSVSVFLDDPSVTDESALRWAATRLPYWPAEAFLVSGISDGSGEQK